MPDVIIEPLIVGQSPNPIYILIRQVGTHKDIEQMPDSVLDDADALAFAVKRWGVTADKVKWNPGRYIPTDPLPDTQPFEIHECCPRCGAGVLIRSYGDEHLCECGCKWHEVDVGALRHRIRDLCTLVEELTDAEECRYDHHGYCQEHSLHEKPCPHERSKHMVSKYTMRLTEAQQ